MHPVVERVSRGLNNKRFTQQEIADASGLSQSTICGLVNARWDRKLNFCRPAPRPSTIAALRAGLQKISSGRRPAHKPVKGSAARSRTHAPRGKENSR